MPRAAILYAMLVAVALSLAGCTAAPSLQSIQVIPSGASLTTVGETVQFKAIGTYQRAGNHPSTTSDITSSVAWASSDVTVTTITSSGLATAAGSGSTMITASIGGTLGSSSLTVSAQAARGLTSIEIIPSAGAQTVSSIGEPTQFIAIGTYSTSPMTVDLTSQVSWQSSDVKVAAINSAGLALGNYGGTTTITAIGKSSSGAAIAATSTLTVSAGGGVTLPLLSVFDVGLGTGIVTSFPAGINCSNIPPIVSSAGCTGSFVFGTAVHLTAVGSNFGGWSSNCIPDTATTCTVTMNNNEPVGAIFN